MQDVAATNPHYVAGLKHTLSEREKDIEGLRTRLKKLAYDEAQHVAAVT